MSSSGAFLLGLLLVVAQASEFFDQECSDDVECRQAFGEHVHCELADSASNSSKCACDEHSGWHKHLNSSCVLHVEVGDICDPGVTVCVTNFSDCHFAGDVQAHFRCACRRNYVETSIGDHRICAHVLAPAANDECSECTGNDGVCFDANEDGHKSGCKCPPTRSGPDCKILHVNVTCSLADFSMLVCYKPHERFENVSSGISFFTKGHEPDPSCAGHEVGDNETSCDHGAMALRLPLGEPDSSRCGTTYSVVDRHRVKYSNSLVVHSEHVTDDLLFSAYCSFNSHTESIFNGIGLVREATGDRGSHSKPTLTFSVIDKLGHEIPEQTALRVGDQIALRIKLHADGTYESLRVENCIASSSSKQPDYHAVTKELLRNGCPAPGQVVFGEANVWHWEDVRHQQLRTGYLKMFKLDVGDTMFLHCSIKLCLHGQKEQCETVDCSGRAGVTNSRARRSPSETAQVSRQLRWKMPALGQTSQQDYSAPSSAVPVIVLLVAIVALLSLAAIALTFRYRRRRDNSGHRAPIIEPSLPDRFALPRLDRNNLRF